MYHLRFCLLSLLAAAPAAAQPVNIDWKLWGDGQAELSGYELRFPRYGEIRSGTAVAIFVTETFSEKSRVKADPGKHEKSDEVPVIKLNWVQDFQTGVYDYNLMTSAFVALSPRGARPAGAPIKLAFSSQEWCGTVYHQLLFDEASIRESAHSYFDGEADREGSLDYPTGGISEDTLLLWARGLAEPVLAPGESANRPLLRGLEAVRLLHKPAAWQRVKLERKKEAVKRTVPAGTFEAEVMVATVDGDRTWTFWVERAAPRRILEISRSDGLEAKLLAGDRMKYWEMNANKFESALTKLGLSRRPPRS
ncbi:MAG: hypothetical protein U1E65_35025 [Myxococcota bacterium]